MTKTALRALTVVALSAAATLMIASPALADPGDPPATDVSVCMAQPELCEPEAPAPAPVPVVDTPAAQPRTPSPAAPAAPSAAAPTAAPGAGQQFQAPLADGYVAVGAPAPAVQGVPLWVLRDKSGEAVRDILARCAWALTAP